MNDPANEYAYYVFEMVDYKLARGFKIHLRDGAKYFTQQRRSVQSFYFDRQWRGKCLVKNQPKNVRYEGCHSSNLANLERAFPKETTWVLSGVSNVPKDYQFIEFESVWDFYKHIGYDHKRNRFVDS